MKLNAAEFGREERSMTAPEQQWLASSSPLNLENQFKTLNSSGEVS